MPSDAARQMFLERVKLRRGEKAYARLRLDTWLLLKERRRAA